MSEIPIQIAETIQTAHIKRHPSPKHDIAPSTAADKKEPIQLEDVDGDLLDHDLDDEDDEEEGIPFRAIRQRPRRATLPPLPDLRFEQSYLHSIREAKSWWMVAWIMARDQIMMPFVQGILYNLALCGWQFWNKNAQLSGVSAGARIRRWWYGVNNWKIPAPGKPMPPIRSHDIRAMS